MKPLHLLVLGVLPLLAVDSFAPPAYAASCSSNACTGTIKELSVFRNANSNGALVRLDQDVAPPGCSLADGTSWLVSKGDDNVIKVLTAAQLSGNMITLRRADGISTCTVDYVTLR